MKRKHPARILAVKGGLLMYFARNRKCAAELRAQERKKPSRIISLLLVISMLCGNFVGMSTGAAEMVAYCGMEEHTHSEACYCAVQAEGEAAAETLAAAVPTGETAAETTEETTAPTEGAALSVSGGSDAQALIGEYVEKELCCGMEEHKHDIACYSNPLADLETAAIWEATLPEKLSGDWGKDLAEVAKSQLGYAESTANYLVGADGETLMGYSRYGAWYSDYTQDAAQAYADWNVPFLFFCLYYAGVEDFPIEENCADWTASLAAAELWRDVAGEYIPEAGDLVFLDTDEDGAADRAAVVTDWDEAKVTAVESDSEGAVKSVTYDLTEDTQVLGYGATNEAQAQIEVSGGEDAETLAATANSNYIYLDTSSMPYGDWSTAYIGGASWNGGWSEASKYDSATGYLYWDVSSWGNTNTNFWIGNSNNWNTIKSDNYRRTSEITMNIAAAKGKVFCWDGSTTATIDGKTVYVMFEGSFSGNDGPVGPVTGTVVDIASKTFNRADNVMYVDASFYDYYTDYEVNGSNRDTNTAGFSVNHDTWVTFRKFDTALSDYYRNNGVKIPLYVGHFQPSWDGFGFQFKDAGLSLYGFLDGQAYGTTSTDQKYFMSVNNSHMDSSSNVNNGPASGLYAYAAQGLVSKSLSGDKLMSVTKSGGTAALPLFNAAFLNGSNSQNKKLGDVYENVSFPFTKQDVDGVDYWVFDSAVTTLEMKKDSSASDAYFLENVGNNRKYKNLDSASAEKSEYGFFPFNSGSTIGNANTYNYGFGCRLDIPFRLTSDGKVKNSAGNRVPIKFNFSGDDDVWVFIDGKLVLDIGGSHGKVTGYIDFANKFAYVDNAKINPGVNNDNSYGNGSKTYYYEEAFDNWNNTDDHVLTMFYMERGMWESNMKVTFNFPDENRLEVEKNLIVNNVNPMFTQSSGTYSGASFVGDNCFDNLKFTFNVQNLATHYGSKAAATGSPIHVDGTPTGYNSNNFNKPNGGFNGYSNVFKWYAGESDDSSQWRHRRYGVIQLTSALNNNNESQMSNGSLNISSMTKLSFYMYVDGDSYDLSHMYLQLVDADVSSSSSLIDTSQSWGATSSGFTGDSNAAGCIGNTSFLKGKTYTSPGTDGRHWVKVTLDLSKFNKASGFDPTRVKYIRFGYDYSLNIYLRDFTFEPSISSSSDVGFTTEQSDIPDYGSASTGTLQNAAGALFTSTASSGSHAVDSSGNFVLVDGESVMFNDQFRRGSYIHLEEVLTPKQDALYNTMWTMYEDGKPVTSLAAADSVVTLSNDSTKYGSLQNKNGNCIDDGRTEKLGSSTEQSNNSYTGSQPSDPTFVFRSYAAPANNMAGIKLKAVFTNTINCGSLYIYKQDAGSTIPSNKEFTFYVRFYDVGGSSLEDNTIIYGPFTLTVNSANGANKKEIQGIPVGTKYSIYEIKDDADYSLNSVTGGSGTFTSTVYGSEDAYRVDGTISSGPASVTFKNIKKPVVSLSVTKAWVDGNGEAITTNLPESITIQLQRRAGSNGTWESVPNVGDRTMKPGYAGWGSYVYTFEELDKCVDYPDNQTVWQYRVLEKNGVNVVAHNTSITIDGVEFVVTYSSENGAAAQDQNGNWSQTITNTQDSSISLELTKKWTDSNGNLLTGSALNLIPSSIKVQLQRRPIGSTKPEDWTPVLYEATGVTTDTTNKTVTISKPTENLTSWSFTFENLDKSGTLNNTKVNWEYRVVEYGNTATIPNGTRVGNFKVSYIVDDYGKVEAATFKSGSDDTLEQTITNKYSPIYITVGKTWAKNTLDKDRSPITVKLQQKVMGSSEDFKDMDGKEATLIAGDNWTVIFTDLPLVTNDGTLYEYNVVEVGENNGHLVHDDILFDVTYVKPNLSTTSDSGAATVTNKPHYVTVDIVKKATGTNTLLSGATFLLEKKGTDGNYTTVGKQQSTDSNGKVTFTGLRIGEYRLTETKAPDGYNLLASPITIEVTTNADNSAYVIKVNGEVQDIEPVENVYTYSTTIYNKPKLDMPATGGVGGFEFWILGGLLIMAVPLLMYTFIWYRKGGKYLQR